VRALHDLPDFEQPTTGERIPLQVAPQTWHNADRQTWLDNLDRLGAQYVLIGKRSIADLDLPADPPELGFARSMPQRFQLIRDNSAAALYRVVGH
jgi:hypothetical protein